MSSFRHLYLHFKTYGNRHRHLYLFSLVLLFWSVFDGIISYVTPLVITEEGFSNTAMGLIYASSSIFGALFDLSLTRYIKNVHFRRIFLFLFIVSFIHPLILWQSKGIFMYLIAMASWGLYYDLINFATFDFVGRKMAPLEHGSSFGVIDVFRATGHIFAPIIAGLVIFELVDWRSFTLSWFFLGVSFLLFLALLVYLKRHHFEYIKPKERKVLSFFREFKSWKSILRVTWPMLTVFILINIYDAFFYTIGPLFSEQFSQIHPLNGLFLAGYSFPILIFGWFIGSLEKKFGKTRLTFLSILMASIVLLFFAFVRNQPIALFVMVLVFSSFISIAAVSSKGIFADYITSKPEGEGEIESVADISVNIGYIIGPVTAGILSDMVGNIEAFSILGVVGVLFSLILLRRK